MKTFPIFNGAKSGGKPWFTVNNLASADAAEILIYEQIGKDWWSGEGIGAKDFIDQVSQIPKGRKIIMRINSPGGNVHDGLAIYSYMQSRKADVTCKVDGVAASIASIIALCGSSCEMPKSSLMMIHDPWTMAQGNAEDMRKAADALDTHKASLVSIYRDKTGKSEAAISAAMSAETWLTGEDAKAFGLCDCCTEEMPAMASAQFDFSNFRHTPDSLKASTPKQPAAPSGTPKPKNNMNKDAIIALLQKKSIEVPKDATEEQLMSLLDGAVNNKTNAPLDRATGDFLAELALMRAERDAAKKAAIRAALQTCVGEFKITQGQLEGFLASCVKDDSLLANIQAMTPNEPGADPVAMHIEITDEAPESYNAAFKKFNAPFDAFAKKKSGSVKDMADASTARAVFIAKNAKRIGEIWNTNTIDSNLKRQVIMQQGIRAFRRVLMPLSAFSTVFQNVALQGTDEVVVPYHALQTVASTDFNGTYSMGDTADSYKKVTVNKRKYQAFDFTSDTMRRQPFFALSKHMELKAEKLALDVFQDVLSIVTAAKFTNTPVTIPAAAFNRDSVADLRLSATQANWPMIGRSMMLDATYDNYLFKDNRLVDVNKSGDAAALRDGTIQKILGFDYYGASNYIPTNSEYLYGLIAYQSAVLVATAPILPTEDVLAQLTSYDVITDEQTGISFEYRRWGAPSTDASNHVVEANYGYEAGEATAITRITSQ